MGLKIRLTRSVRSKAYSLVDIYNNKINKTNSGFNMMEYKVYHIINKFRVRCT